MLKENPYTGESTNLDSPFISEQEAEMNAAIGATIYGGMHQQPQGIGGAYPGGYGYNPNNPYLQDLSQQPHQFNNPYFNNPFYQNALQNSMSNNNRMPVVSGYGVVGNGIGNGIPGGYSPATFGDNSSAYGGYNPYGYGNYPQQYSAQQEYQVYVEPLRMNGEYMPFMDQEDRLNGIFEREYNRMIEDEANGAFTGLGNNYYGTPFATSRRSTQFERDLNELKQGNMENRRQFDIKLSKAAHHFQGDDITDDEIEDIYTGYTVNTGLRMVSHNRRAAFNTMYYVNDNHEAYAEADAKITENFYKTIGVDPEHCDMKTFFDNIGAYGFAMEMEEERKRRVKTKQYNTNTFTYMLKMKRIERLAEKYGYKPNLDGINNGNNILMNYNTMVSPMHNPNFINPALEILGQNNQPITPVTVQPNGQVDTEQIRKNLSQFSTLAKATVSDDGTININYGMDDIHEIMRGLDADNLNENEKDYEAKREAFAETIFAPKQISPYYKPPEKYKDLRMRGG